MNSRHWQHWYCGFSDKWWGRDFFVIVVCTIVRWCAAINGVRQRRPRLFCHSEFVRVCDQYVSMLAITSGRDGKDRSLTHSPSHPPSLSVSLRLMQDDDGYAHTRTCRHARTHARTDTHTRTQTERCRDAETPTARLPATVPFAGASTRCH